jgi:hypothetical protein
VTASPPSITPTYSFYLDSNGQPASGLSVEDINTAIAEHACRLWVDVAKARIQLQRS